jgi:zinc protease
VSKRVKVLAILSALILTSSNRGVSACEAKTGGAGQASGFVLPILKRDSLLNGLHLIVYEQKGTGSVTTRLRVNAGGMFDLANKGGLSDLTAGMLLRGGGGLTASNIQGLVEQTGLKIGVTAGWDSTDLIVSGPADALDSIFELLGQLIIKPAFDQKELDSLKATRIEAIKAEGLDDGESVRKKALEAVFGSHPYGRPLRGSAESLAQISRADLNYFHGRFYVANNSELIITGDATAEMVTRLARARLGAWKKGERVPATFRPPDPLQARRVIINDRPGPLSHAVIAQVGASRRASDFFAVMVMGEVLAQMSSKLSAAGSPVETRLDARYLAGPLTVEIKASPSEMVEKIEGVISMMTSLQSLLAAPDQVESAKARIINSFAERLRSSDGAAGVILDIELYGLGKDYLVNFVDRVNAIVAADVMRAAQTYLKPQSLAIVVAGPAGELEASLKRLGTVTAMP